MVHTTPHAEVGLLVFLPSDARIHVLLGHFEGGVCVLERHVQKKGPVFLRVELGNGLQRMASVQESAIGCVVVEVGVVLPHVKPAVDSEPVRIMILVSIQEKEASVEAPINGELARNMTPSMPDCANIGRVERW